MKSKHYHEGWQAYVDGNYADCPYPEPIHPDEEQERYDWEDGWAAAYNYFMSI